MENPSPENSEQIRKASEELDHQYKKEQEKYVKNKIAELNNAHTNKKSKVVWQIANEISNRKKSKRSILKGKSKQDRLNQWKNHFSNLLGQAPPIINIPTKRMIDAEFHIEKNDFTMKELQIVIKNLKNNKASGIDNIPAEVWKAGICNEQLLYICNRVYNQQPVDTWRQSCIIPLPKKGDLRLATNYRGISLTPTAAKIYNKLLLHRIRPVLENILRDNQNGFREKRSTTAQIFTLRLIIEGVKQKQLPAVIIFVDFSKAFYSIDRSKMEQILETYGIPNEIIKAIMTMYKNIQVFVRSPDGDAEFFDIIAGVLQGDTLAPYLFIIVLDYVLRNLDQNENFDFTLRKQLSRRYPDEMLTDVGFADDLALLSDKIGNAEKLLKILETAAASVGFYINTTKTKLIAVNTEGTITAQNGCDLEQVNDFNYLDSKIISSENDIQVRICSP